MGQSWDSVGRDRRPERCGERRPREQFVTGPAAYNDSFWQERTTFSVIPNIVKNGIPVLLWSGWYPVDGPGSLEEYAEFQNTYDHRYPYGPMTPGRILTKRFRGVCNPLADAGSTSVLVHHWMGELQNCRRQARDHSCLITTVQPSISASSWRSNMVEGERGDARTARASESTLSFGTVAMRALALC